MSKIKHLGIIMDGNRRWARENSLPEHKGHQKGYEKLIEVGDWCLEKGIETLSVYAFSTENWKRSKKEVELLMKLLEKAFTEEVEKFNKKGIKVNVIGSREKLSKKLLEQIEGIQEKTKNNSKGILNLCFNYGGRLEMVETIKKIVEKGYKASDITEDLITKNTWMGEQEDPDLIIRTSGEQRLSGFLTWQAVYSEFYFTDTHWPAFSKNDFESAIGDYENRHRKFGGN